MMVGGTAVTPMKRVPILANFEEWMKMATDNKINAANSWNFALIDYFHDMSLLKEGDGVNFQKASCTLDGCVKIYTSRVDSVATETGKLLSGLADSGNSKKKKGENEEGEESEEEEVEDEDGVVRKKPKKRVSSLIVFVRICFLDLYFFRFSQVSSQTRSEAFKCALSANFLNHNHYLYLIKQRAFTYSHRLRRTGHPIYSTLRRLSGAICCDRTERMAAYAGSGHKYYVTCSFLDLCKPSPKTFTYI